MNNIKIIPWHMGHSGSREVAAALSDMIGRRVWRWYASKEHEYDPGNLHINFGSGTLGEWAKQVPDSHMLNKPWAIKNAVNKTRTFEILQKAGIPTVEWTTDMGDAIRWTLAGEIVVCRTMVGSFAGKGIVVAHSPQELVEAPLYTKFLKDTKEFRVHAINGKAVDTQEKRTRRNIDKVLINREIRSHHEGWVFCRKDVVKPKGLDQISIDAIQALGLDFGGVDVIYSNVTNKCYILEVNTAPGLEGSTIKIFADAFYNYYKENK